jgi:ligand-binding sensor domain-containing protein
MNLNVNVIQPNYVKSLNSLRGDPECILQNNDKVYIVYRNPTNLYEIDIQSGLMENIVGQDNGVLFNKLVFCMYLDNFNTLCVGTNKGLVKYTQDSPKPKFDKLLSSEEKPISTREIIEDENGDFYVATYAGFFKYDKHKNQWKNFNQLLFNGKLSFFYQRALLNVSSRYMYLGTDANYFVRFDKQKQSFESDFVNNPYDECWKIKSVLSMAMDAKGLVWLGTDKGLVSMDTISNEAIQRLLFINAKWRFRI